MNRSNPRWNQQFGPDFSSNLHMTCRRIERFSNQIFRLFLFAQPGSNPEARHQFVAVALPPILAATASVEVCHERSLLDQSGWESIEALDVFFSPIVLNTLRPLFLCPAVKCRAFILVVKEWHAEAA